MADKKKFNPVEYGAVPVNGFDPLAAGGSPVSNFDRNNSSLPEINNDVQISDGQIYNRQQRQPSVIEQVQAYAADKKQNLNDLMLRGADPEEYRTEGNSILRDIATGAAKSATKHLLNLGGVTRKALPFLNKISPDPLESIVPAVSNPEPYSLFNERGQNAIGLNPSNIAQNAGGGLESMGEYFLPGGAIEKSAAGFGKFAAEALPNMPKLASWAKPAASALLEGGSAAGISNLQGEDPTTQRASLLLGMASPGIGKGISSLTQKALPASLAEAIPGVKLEPKSMLYRAIKPRNKNLGFDMALDLAVPEINATAKASGRPIQDLGDLANTINATKKQIWGKYSDLLNRASEANGDAPEGMIDGNTFGDAIKKSITARTRQDYPELANGIEEIAGRYRRPFNVLEAEDYLQDVNRDLFQYYAKNRVGRQAALADPEKAWTVALGDEIRDQLYKKLDETGPGAADLKRKYGALLNMENAVSDRIVVAARQNPESLSQILAKLSAAGDLVSGNPIGAARGAAKIALGDVLKNRNSPDYLVMKAFQDYDKFVKQASRSHRIIGATPAAVNSAGNF